MKRVTSRGLAAVAALALTMGVGAASASASGFMADEYPASLSGASTSFLAVNTNIHNFNCETALSGTLSGPTKSAAVSMPSEIKCGSAKVKTNGCTLNLKPGAETGEGVFSGTAEIAVGCSGIAFTNSLGCTANFPPQGGIAATFEKVGSGSTAGFNLSLSGSGLEYVTSGAGCAPATYKNGTASGSWSVAAESKGKQTGVHVAHQIGFHMGGEQSEDPSKQPRFKAENYPAGIVGEQTTQHLLKTGAAGTLSCNTVNLAGTLSAASPEALLSPEFKTCKLAGNKLKVRTNGCLYEFHVANVAGPYAGTLELSCSGWNQLEFEYNSGGCTVVLPEQTLAAVSYEDIGVGAERKVVAQLTGEGIDYGLSAGCLNPGFYNDATLGGASTLEAML